MVSISLVIGPKDNQNEAYNYNKPNKWRKDMIWKEKKSLATESKREEEKN